MKKIFTFIFLMLMFVSIRNVSALEGEKTITNNNNIVISEERFLELMNAGYTIDEIYNMDQDEYDNADTNNPNIATSTKYLKTIETTRYGNTTSETYEITKEEYENGNDDGYTTFGSSIVTTTYKQLTASITPTGTGNGFMLYKAYLYWKNIPSTRSNDIIGMGFESDTVEVVYSPDFRQLYTYNGTTYVNSNCTIKESTNGRGAVFQLPTNDIVTLCQEISFEVDKLNQNQTITHLEGAGDYAHATETVSSSLAHNNYYVSDIGGLVLYSPIINKYDSMSAALVYWDGTW